MGNTSVHITKDDKSNQINKPPSPSKSSQIIENVLTKPMLLKICCYGNEDNFTKAIDDCQHWYNNTFIPTLLDHDIEKISNYVQTNFQGSMGLDIPVTLWKFSWKETYPPPSSASYSFSKLRQETEGKKLDHIIKSTDDYFFNYPTHIHPLIFMYFISSLNIVKLESDNLIMNNMLIKWKLDYIKPKRRYKCICTAYKCID